LTWRRERQFWLWRPAFSWRRFGRPAGRYFCRSRSRSISETFAVGSDICLASFSFFPSFIGLLRALIVFFFLFLDLSVLIISSTLRCCRDSLIGYAQFLEAGFTPTFTIRMYELRHQEAQDLIDGIQLAMNKTQ
jgi:hypothetical protein